MSWEQNVIPAPRAIPTMEPVLNFGPESLSSDCDPEETPDEEVIDDVPVVVAETVMPPEKVPVGVTLGPSPSVSL